MLVQPVHYCFTDGLSAHKGPLPLTVLHTFDLHYAIISLENQFLVFFLSGRLRQVLLYYILMHLIL